MPENATSAPDGASNSDAILFELAEQARRLFRRSTSDALGCGRLLIEAREVADHGRWLVFLTDAGIHARTAQRLMRIADYVGKCPVKYDTVSHLGVRRTLDFLRARDRAMATWRAACQAEPDNHELSQGPPGCPLTGMAWCDDPADRAVMAEVAAHVLDIGVEELLTGIEAELSA